MADAPLIFGGTHPAVEIVALLGIAAAGLTAIGVIVQKGIRPFWRFSRRLFRIVEDFYEIAPLLDELPDALPVLVGIAEEFKPNEGASLRDAINRIEYAVSVNSNRIASICEQLEAGCE